MLQDVKVLGASEGKWGVSFVITGSISHPDVDALTRCLPLQERLLPQTGSVTEAFRGLHWSSRVEATLASCTAQACPFKLPHWAWRKIAAAGDLAARKAVYYAVVRELTWKIAKQKKRHRIAPHEAAAEPCAKHDLFHWLLNGPPKRWDRVVWRRHYGDSRMRPTLTANQISSWKKGEQRCIGTTLLFADHYYDDGLDLLQLTPQGGKVAFRFYTLDRFDIFNSWLARRFRGKIRTSVRERKLKLLRNRVARCLKSK